MYYRRQLPIMSGVYRPLETRRFVMTTMGGYWPVIDKLTNGHLGVVTRDGDFHVGQRGRLTFLTSPDGGESWSHATVISAGSDSRNPAFGVTADGTLLASFIENINYIDGENLAREDFRPTPLYLARSEDNGETWSTELARVDGRDSWSVGSPFGRIITLSDGALLMTWYLTGTASTIRSHDGGRTWVDPVEISDGGYNETSVVELGEGRLLVVMRRDVGDGLRQSDSEDNGYTWTEPRRITGPAEHPGDIIRLQDERVLLTYGRRVTPFGIQGMVSHDDGKSWDESNKLLLVADAGIDQGYPSTTQRDDGTLVTVYYSSELDLRQKKPRPEILGIHGAAVLYRPEDF